MSFPFSVPRKTAYTRYMDDMAFGLSAMVPGKTHYVRPTTNYASYDADAWIKNHNHNVYDSFKLAHDACVAGRGDAIVFAPGTHTVSTASIAMSKAGVSLWGPEAWMGREAQVPTAILTTDITADQIGNITAPDIGFYGLTIRPITAAAAFDFSAAAHNLRVEGCHLDLYTPAVSTSTVGFSAGGAATGMRFVGNNVISDGAQGNALVMTATTNSLIADNRFVLTAGSWASVILCGAATDTLVIDNNLWIGSGTAITVGINGTGATLASGVFVTRNVNSVLVTKLVDNFDAGECDLGINYIMTDTGGTGGTLVTLTT